MKVIRERIWEPRVLQISIDVNLLFRLTDAQWSAKLLTDLMLILRGVPAYIIAAFCCTGLYVRSL
jgi:hypothetical protein